MAEWKRHTPEQITSILRQQEAGLKVAEICRQHGISEPTFCCWNSRYGEMGASELRRLMQLEEENRRLEKIVGNQALDIHAMKTIIERKY